MFLFLCAFLFIVRMYMKKFRVWGVWALLLSFVLTTSQTFAATFSDVSENNQYQSAVELMVTHEIMRGYADGMFRPERAITNAELLATVLRTYHIEVYAKETGSLGSLKDVYAGDWYESQVKKALKLGLISDKDAYFYPNEPASRLAIIRWVFNVEGIPTGIYRKESAEQEYIDVRATDPYYAMVHRALNLGLIDPVNAEGGVFGIGQHLSRGETALILSRVLQDSTYISPMMQNTLTSTGSNVDIEYTTSQPMKKPKLTVDMQQGTAYYNIFDNEEFRDVWESIKNRYIFKDKINEKDARYAVIKGLVNSLDDKYSDFLTPEENADFTSSALQGEMEGIGVYVIQDKDTKEIEIQYVLPETPAEKAGLMSGDIIVSVNGEDVREQYINDVTKKIRGKAGTPVTVGVLRQGQVLSLEITRAKFPVHTVRTAVLEGAYLYVKIQDFRDTTAAEFDTLVAQVVQKNPQAYRGIILDMRDNPGGYLDESLKILDHFIEKGKDLVLVEYRDGTVAQQSFGPGELASIPTVVLQNGNTASAAEVVAGALHDHLNVKLIGEKSFGKGTVQELRAYEDGAALKLSIAKWMTPLTKTWIHGKGLPADVEVKAVESATTTDQLANQQALKSLAKFATNPQASSGTSDIFVAKALDVLKNAGK